MVEVGGDCISNESKGRLRDVDERVGIMIRERERALDIRPGCREAEGHESTRIRYNGLPKGAKS